MSEILNFVITVIIPSWKQGSKNLFKALYKFNIIIYSEVSLQSNGSGL